jgi:hypothetical protein
MKSVIVTGIVLLLVGPAGGNLAQAAAPGFVAARECQEHQAFVAGDAAAVAARLPARYTPVSDVVSGRPLLFARAIRCDARAVGAQTAPVTMASFGIVVESPDGRGCASGAPVLGAVKGDVPPVCNWYTLFWLADDARVVDWLRADTPEFPAVFVPGLRFGTEPFSAARGGAAMHFSAPAPSPSPFTMEDVGRQRPGSIPVRGGYWADTADGTVKVAFSTEDLVSGDATGTVSAQPGSEMAQLLGAESRPFLPGYSVVAAESWTRASYRKQVLGPAGAGQTLDSFEGSCAVQGTNTFSPPITNADGILAFDYRGDGRCTGSIDGRRVTDAPVQMHNAGMAAGSCLRAHTLDPGQTTLTFADGQTVRATFDFTFTTTEGDVEWYGERSGLARGHGSFLTTRSPPDVALHCASGGNAELPLDVSLTTESPLVSEPRGVPPAAATAAPKALRLSGRPARARAGRRTAFAFHVRTAGGRPVPGAIVSFAGHRVRAGRAGDVRLAATLRRPGRWVASASRRGFSPARFVVAVARRR